MNIKVGSLVRLTEREKFVALVIVTKVYDYERVFDIRGLVSIYRNSTWETLRTRLGNQEQRAEVLC